MGNYLRIARVYLRKETAVAWCFLLLCLLSVSAGAGELASRQGGILGGVLSIKSYMAMFTYFNACLLGVVLRDGIARPWASVLPHYREKHLLVAALIALLFLGIPIFSLMFAGTSDIAPTSVVVIFLTCLAAGLWTLHHPLMGFLALPFLVFVAAPASSFRWLAAFLAGTNPAASAALALLSLLALGALARRLLVMKEDTLEFAFARLWGDFLNGRGEHFGERTSGIAGGIAAVPADQRAPLQKLELLKNPLSNLRAIDNLSIDGRRSLWRRVQLWRLGTAPTRTALSVASLMAITFILMPVMLATQALPARNTVVIFSVQIMLNPFGVWLSWFNRLHRLGFESLRPRTRREFVRELGLAFLCDGFEAWLGGVLFMGICAVIWAPELLQVKNIILFICCTGAGQLCVSAMMGIWCLKRGTIASVVCTLCAFMAIALWMIRALDDGVGLEVNIAIALVLYAASAAAIAPAYRRWRLADLE